MQPDAVARAALAAVPFVRVADRERPVAVELARLAVGGIELVARDDAGHVVDAERGLLVAFLELVDAILADGDVIVRDIARLAAVVLEYVQR
ncbi:hypothetical protein D3C83_90070 [compost metagenome]